MIALWLIFGGMVILALAFLLRPLLYGPGREARPAAAHDMEVYRDQLRELERERAEGRIGAAEAGAARREIERRLLAADQEAGGTDAPRQRPLPRLAFAVTVLVPLAAGVLYFMLGAPGLPSGSTPDGEQRGVQDAGERAAMIRGMVARLETRLEQNPDDAAGWRRLGRSYFVLGRREDAIRAYGRAATLVPDDVAVMADYATAILASAPESERPPERAIPVLRQLLGLEGNHPLALYYLGIAEARGGNDRVAREHFRRLRDQLPEDALLRREIENRLSRLRQE